MVLMRLGRLDSYSKDSEDLLTSRDFVRRWGNRLGKAAPPEPLSNKTGTRGPF